MTPSPPRPRGTPTRRPEGRFKYGSAPRNPSRLLALFPIPALRLKAFQPALRGAPVPPRARLAPVRTLSRRAPPSQPLPSLTDTPPGLLAKSKLLELPFRAPASGPARTRSYSGRGLRPYRAGGMTRPGAFSPAARGCPFHLRHPPAFRPSQNNYTIQNGGKIALILQWRFIDTAHSSPPRDGAQRRG